MIEYIPWLVNIITIIGVILNIKKKASGFIWLSLGCICWLMLSIWIPDYQKQIPQGIVFIILNIIGYIQWKKI